MRLLKGLVIGMGILIVLGIIAVAYGIYMKVGKSGEQAPAAVDTPSVPLSGGEAFTSDIALADGERLLSVEYPDGRIALRIASDDGSERIILLNAATGAVTGTVKVKGND